MSPYEAKSDPFTAYQDGAGISSPTVLVIGKHADSGAGEYVELARTLGCRLVDCAVGAGTVADPLEPPAYLGTSSEEANP